ncbi:MAG: transglutaminase-like domain-containing protein, partial [Pirellulales bacterium]
NACERSLARRPIAPGQSRRLRSFDPTLMEVGEETLTAGSLGGVKTSGTIDDLLPVRRVVRYSSGEELTYTLRVDDAGKCWKTKDDTLGFESRREPREIALAPAGRGSFNLLANTRIELVGRLPHGRQTRRAVYRCSTTSQQASDLFTTDAFQSVRAIDATSARVEVGKSTGAMVTPPSEDDRQPGMMVQSDDARVAAMANEAAAGAGGPEATSPVAMGVALERFLHRKMKNVNFTQAFASAAEVAVALEGDCSEHAVLLCALARARGLPARVAMGLVYVPEPDALAYHMWTEVWIAEKGGTGYWKPLDATTPDGVARAVYLKVADTHLKAGMADPAFYRVARLLGSGLKIEVIESE